MSRIYLALSRIGARLGNWNDDHFGDLSVSRANKRKAWKRLDRIAGRLYVLGDKAHR